MPDDAGARRVAAAIRPGAAAAKFSDHTRSARQIAVPATKIKPFANTLTGLPEYVGWMGPRGSESIVYGRAAAGLSDRDQ
jgi:hypothetical protein